MALTIEHYPNARLQIGGRLLTIDLHEAFQKKLAGEQLTNAKAIIILKEIKWRSDVLSFFTKPVVLIPFSIIVLISSFLCPLSHIAFIILGILLASIGGGLLGGSVYFTYNKILPKISEAYSQLSTRASEYVRQIEVANRPMNFVFA